MSQQQPQPQQDETDATAAEGPEIVSEFPAPPAFFVLYRDGADQGPPPPEPMAPTYHMFGTPYSTQDAVPDLLPQEGRKLYLDSSGSAASRSDNNSDSAAAAASSASGSDSDGSGATPESGEKLSGDEGEADLALDERQIDYKGQMKKCVHVRARYILVICQTPELTGGYAMDGWHAHVKQDQPIAAGELCRARGRADQAAVHVQVR